MRTAGGFVDGVRWRAAGGHGRQVAMPRDIAIHADEVHLWWADLDEDAPGCGALLDAAEWSRACRFHFERDRARFVARHSFVRRVLARYLGVAPADLPIEATAAGKPRLAAADGVSFSVSHTAGMAVVAIAAGAEVGVDIESVRPIGDASELADGLFSHPERDEVRAARDAERDMTFLRLWTRKEALLKAMGTGLSVRLSDFDVSSRGSADGRPRGPGGRLPYVVAGLEAPRGLIGALSLAGPGFTISQTNTGVPS